MRTSRLEAFSDGVLAIIITIMVLELREPTGSDLAALWDAAGTGILSYLLSFTYVGIYWTNHHHMFQLTERVTGGVLWANLGLLFCISLFPFTTQWTDETGYARTPVVVYGLNLLAAAIAYFILQTAIIRSQGRDSRLRKAIGRDLKGKLSPAGYIAGCVAALLAGAGHGAGRPGIWIAVACYVAVACVWVIPDRRIETTIAAPVQGAPASPDPPNPPDSPTPPSTNAPPNPPSTDAPPDPLSTPSSAPPDPPSTDADAPPDPLSTPSSAPPDPRPAPSAPPASDT